MNMNNDATEFMAMAAPSARRKKVGLGPLGFLSFLGITMGVLILMAMAAPSARAALETYYDFEDFNFTSDSPGLQTTNISAPVGVIGLCGVLCGTNVNAVTPSTNAALIVPLPGGGGGTAASFTLGGLTTTGLTDVNLSFALVSGGTGTFTTLDLLYSTTGMSGPYTHFSTVVGINNLSTYTGPPLFSFDVSTLTGGAVDGVSGSNLFFEFSFSGRGAETTDFTRIDNIQVTAVPEPSSYIGSLVGLLGLCWFQRRWFTRLLSSRSA